MPAFKTRPGEGKVSNFGYDFDEVDGTEVFDADVAERLRKHPQFEEVVGKVAAPPVEPVPAVMPLPSPAAEHHDKRKLGRQPYPRDAHGHPIKPVKTDG